MCATILFKARTETKGLGQHITQQGTHRNPRGGTHREPCSLYAERVQGTLLLQLKYDRSVRQQESNESRFR